MTRRIVVTSGKGGVGKTTFVAFFGTALARMGYKVLLVDMDFGLNNLDVLMGVENKIVYDIIDVIEGRCLPAQAIIEYFYEKNLYVLPTINGFCSKKFSSKELLTIIKDVEKDYNFVIIDCPAGIDGGFVRAIECGDEHIVLTTPHFSAIRDCSKVINKLTEMTNSRPYLIVNRVRGDLMLDGEMVNIDQIRECLNGDLVGVIPEDDCVNRQLILGGVLDNLASSKKAIDIIATNIIYGENKLYDCVKKYKGIFGGIRKSLRKRI